VLVVLILALAACGGKAAQPSAGGSAGQPAAAGAGNAENGKKLFSNSIIASAGSPGCITCHSLEKGKTLVGPSLAGVAGEAQKALKDAGYRGKATTAEEFLKESILEPDVYVTQGFQPGVMPKTYNKLTAQELGDLVAYLATLK
jgi:nitric oxide reductase subunit C